MPPALPALLPDAGHPGLELVALTAAAVSLALAALGRRLRLPRWVVSAAWGLVACCLTGLVLLLALPPVARVPVAGPRTLTGARLREIAQAMHAYAEDHGGRLPTAAVYAQDGRPLVSWRVLLLPYAGQKNLYREFRLDEPWDGPHNLALLPRMPEVYAPPAVGGRRVDPAATFYQVFVGPGTAFEGHEGLRLPDDFPDGTSNTVLVAEAGEPVPGASRPTYLTTLAGRCPHSAA